MYIDAAMIRTFMLARRGVLLCRVRGHGLSAQGLLTEPEWQFTALWMLTSYVFLLR